MPRITEVPCEMVAAILRNLDHPRHLSPALLACRQFYTTFKESHGVEASILSNQITPALLPHAVAVMEARRLPHPLVASSVLGLLDELYHAPSRLAARVPALPVPALRTMGHTHDAVHALATGFAASAWERISPPPPPTTTSTALSPTEYFRCRAFYRAELFYILFRDGHFDETMNPWFFFRHRIWENEQLASVSEYLEQRFVQASHDVVAHDVEFGEMGIDYLESGPDNSWRQGWLSHGVRFVYKLTITDSYEAKHRMLSASTYILDSIASLPEALWHVIGFDQTDSRTVAEYSDAELHSMVQRHGDETWEDDTDPGPYESWRGENATRWLEDTCMFRETAWLRERAYVFWDMDRLETLSRGFGDDPGDPRDYTEAEYKEMMESFDERSKIWQKGGQGYWSKNDTSRMVYCLPHGVLPPSS